MNNQIKVSGHITLELFDISGLQIDKREVNNLIVTVGKNFLAQWLTTAQSDSFMKFVGLGTGSDLASSFNTDLSSPLPTRLAGVLTSSNNTLQNVSIFGPTINTATISEAGLFSALSGGTMFARQAFPPLVKDLVHTLRVTWRITFS